MRRFIHLLVLSLIAGYTSCSQNAGRQPARNQPNKKEIKVGGNCEGCEAIYECPVPFDHLNEVDTLPDFNDPGPKLEISGIIYQSDGRTPAPDVVLYVYHTDQKGVYPVRGNPNNWARRHGYIRGWLRTNAKGEYKLYTLVPASYPNSNNPKHIHPIIKEAGKSEYWIDEFVFDNDPLLPESERTRSKPVGGSGVLKTTLKDDMLRATRNIVLGLYVPAYGGSL